jgi:hypothetical protein
MRLKSLFLMLSGALLVLALVPPQATTQAPGDKKGKGGGKVDPYRMFDFLAKGRDHFLISETSELRDSLLKYAREKGITDGRLTREQFAAWAADLVAKLAAEGVPVDTKLLLAAAATGSGDKDKPGGGFNPEIWLPQIQLEFQKRDEDSDQKLSRKEMPGNLRDKLDRWDKNKDTLIDFNEFKDYYFDRLQEKAAKDAQKAAKGKGDPKKQPGNGGTSSGNGTSNPGERTTVNLDDLDAKPLVYRADSLPSDVPGWFKEYDEDKDLQVALYEWRKHGKSDEEFMAMDRNEDGLLTVEEVVRFVRQGRGGNGSGPDGRIITGDPGRAGAGEPPSGKMDKGGKGKGKKDKKGG